MNHSHPAGEHAVDRPAAVQVSQGPPLLAQEQTPEQSGRGGHGMHKWMMLLMCLPLVLFGAWQLISGGGARGLLSGLACVAMMAVMHLAMGGHGKGGGHRH